MEDVDEYIVWGFGFVYDYKIATTDTVVLCTDVQTGKPAYTYHIHYSADRSIYYCDDDVNGNYGVEVLHEVMELARHRGETAEWRLVSVKNPPQLQKLVEEEEKEEEEKTEPPPAPTLVD